MAQPREGAEDRAVLLVGAAIPDARSLVSALAFGELRTSGLASQVEPGGELRTLRVGGVDVRDVDVQTALGSLRAASVELSDVAVRMPASAPGRFPTITVGQLRLKDASVSPHAASLRTSEGAPQPWRLDPFGALEGTLHADIVDAAWIFDADVTVPISGGRIDFNRATVEHIGPDSSMGVSRMGVYVDAPNGRTYLFVLSATHVPGARFERREGALLPGWRGDRGSIELQPLLEALLSGVPIGALATGMRDMLARTRVHGEFRLGDGVLGNERRRVVLAGSDQGRNRVELSSAPSGDGIVLRMPALAASELRWESAGIVVSTAAVSATLSLTVDDARPTPAVTVSIAELKLDQLSASERPST